METETKVCRDCGRELTIDKFTLSRFGKPSAVCRECRNEKYRDTRFANKQQRTAIGGGAKPHPFSDPDFDGKTIREVMDMMSRAKRWLEAQGCEIYLSGNLKKVIIQPLKFQ